MTPAPDSYALWLKTMCGLRLNPAVGLGVPDQPPWLVLNEANEAIGVAADLRAGTFLIDRYIAEELKQRGRAAARQYTEPAHD